MPIISSTFKPPFLLGNGHVQTIYPNLFRNIRFIEPSRSEEISTRDNDFLELDWYEQPGHTLAILLHGLEGDSKRTYMLGMARELYHKGMNVLCWNYRSCGSKVNKQLRFYHSGDTDDISDVLAHVLALGKYREVVLIGFSMGGNITLKYLGEQSHNIDPRIKCAVAISAPVHLASSSQKMMQWQNKLYMRRFLNRLRKKIEAKIPYYPEHLSLEGFHRIKSFKDFDDRYTASIHGFENAEDYWDRASSIHVLHQISIPTLLINARNDSFLGDQCYPIAIAESSEYLYLEMPDSGGHVGFMNFGQSYWSERRAWEFIHPHLDRV